MPAPNTITVDKLARLIGTPACPVVVDLRSDGDLIPGSVRRPAEGVDRCADSLGVKSVVALCTNGTETSPSVAAWLRTRGIGAETLDGGVAAWTKSGLATVRQAALPPRDDLGRTRWVTRGRPKVDRIACPWLIRRFVDPDAMFLFAAPTEVASVGEHWDAAPFDVDGVFWSHRDELCTFDVLVDELGLASLPGLQRLAVIVRGADTARPDIAPQAAGLLAASLGLSRMFADDHEQLEAGMLFYDAFYRWCRDAVDETHDWVSHAPKAKVRA
jgi:rhodanese-related sulfurtransferase